MSFAHEKDGAFDEYSWRTVGQSTEDAIDLTRVDDSPVAVTPKYTSDTKAAIDTAGVIVPRMSVEEVADEDGIEVGLLRRHGDARESGTTWDNPFAVQVKSEDANEDAPSHEKDAHCKVDADAGGYCEVIGDDDIRQGDPLKDDQVEESEATSNEGERTRLASLLASTVEEDKLTFYAEALPFMTRLPPLSSCAHQAFLRELVFLLSIPDIISEREDIRAWRDKLHSDLSRCTDCVDAYHHAIDWLTTAASDRDSSKAFRQYIDKDDITRVANLLQSTMHSSGLATHAQDRQGATRRAPERQPGPLQDAIKVLKTASYEAVRYLGMHIGRNVKLRGLVGRALSVLSQRGAYDGESELAWGSHLNPGSATAWTLLWHCDARVRDRARAQLDRAAKIDAGSISSVITATAWAVDATFGEIDEGVNGVDPFFGSRAKRNRFVALLILMRRMNSAALGIFLSEAVRLDRLVAAIADAASATDAQLDDKENMVDATVACLDLVLGRLSIGVPYPFEKRPLAQLALMSPFLEIAVALWAPVSSTNPDPFPVKASGNISAARVLECILRHCLVVMCQSSSADFASNNRSDGSKPAVGIMDSAVEIVAFVVRECARARVSVPCVRAAVVGSANEVGWAGGLAMCGAFRHLHSNEHTHQHGASGASGAAGMKSASHHNDGGSSHRPLLVSSSCCHLAWAALEEYATSACKCVATRHNSTETAQPVSISLAPLTELLSLRHDGDALRLIMLALKCNSDMAGVFRTQPLSVSSEPFSVTDDVTACRIKLASRMGDVSRSVAGRAEIVSRLFSSDETLPMVAAACASPCLELASAGAHVICDYLSTRAITSPDASTDLAARMLQCRVKARTVADLGRRPSLDDAIVECVLALGQWLPVLLERCSGSDPSSAPAVPGEPSPDNPMWAPALSFVRALFDGAVRALKERCAVPFHNVRRSVGLSVKPTTAQRIAVLSALDRAEQGRSKSASETPSFPTTPVKSVANAPTPLLPTSAVTGKSENPPAHVTAATTAPSVASVPARALTPELPPKKTSLHLSAAQPARARTGPVKVMSLEEVRRLDAAKGTVARKTNPYGAGVTVASAPPNSLPQRSGTYTAPHNIVPARGSNAVAGPPVSAPSARQPSVFAGSGKAAAVTSVAAAPVPIVRPAPTPIFPPQQPRESSPFGGGSDRSDTQTRGAAVVPQEFYSSVFLLPLCKGGGGGAGVLQRDTDDVLSVIPTSFSSEAAFRRYFMDLLKLELQESLLGELQRWQSKRRYRLRFMSESATTTPDGFVDFKMATVDRASGVSMGGDSSSLGGDFGDNDIVLLWQGANDPFKAEDTARLLSVVLGGNRRAGSVSMRAQRRMMGECSAIVLDRAASAARAFKSVATLPQNWVRRLVSPVCELPRSIVPPEEPNPGWMDAIGVHLNEGQRMAVKSALSVKEGLALWQGPPGTGKTKTVLAFLGLALRPPTDPNGMHTKVLLCAPSNAAVEEVVRRIRRDGLVGCDGRKFFPEMLHLTMRDTHDDADNNNAGAQAHETEAQLIELNERLGMMQLASREDPENAASLAEEIAYLSAQIRSLEASLMGRAEAGVDAATERRQREEKMSKCELVCCTLSSAGNMALWRSPKRFEWIVVDEAAQSIEPETLIPISAHRCPRMLLVGDPRQLPATVVSAVAKKNGLGQSLFERITRHYEPKGVDQIPVVMLTEQYRMHPDICRFPSDAFYDGRVVTSAERMSWPTPSFYDDGRFGPYVFYDVAEGEETRQAGSYSVGNVVEAKFIARVIHELRLKHFTHDNPAEFARRVGVITPYQQQTEFIRHELVKFHGLDRVVASNVEISTVDGFQGREMDIIILSCVRATDQLGFLTDARRMNVALTRSRLALVVVGSAGVLSRSGLWRNLIEDARRRGLVRSTKSLAGENAPRTKPVATGHAASDRSTDITSCDERGRRDLIGRDKNDTKRPDKDRRDDVSRSDTRRDVDSARGEHRRVADPRANRHDSNGDHVSREADQRNDGRNTDTHARRGDGTRRTYDGTRRIDDTRRAVDDTRRGDDAHHANEDGGHRDSRVTYREGAKAYSRDQNPTSRSERRARSPSPSDSDRATKKPRHDSGSADVCAEDPADKKDRERESGRSRSGGGETDRFEMVLSAPIPRDARQDQPTRPQKRDSVAPTQGQTQPQAHTQAHALSGKSQPPHLPVGSQSNPMSDFVAPHWPGADSAQDSPHSSPPMSARAGTEKTRSVNPTAINMNIVANNKNSAKSAPQREPHALHVRRGLGQRAVAADWFRPAVDNRGEQQSDARTEQRRIAQDDPSSDASGEQPAAKRRRGHGFASGVSRDAPAANLQRHLARVAARSAAARDKAWSPFSS